MGRIGYCNPFRGRFRGENCRVGTVDDFDAVLIHDNYPIFLASALEVHFRCRSLAVIGGGYFVRWARNFLASSGLREHQRRVHCY